MAFCKICACGEKIVFEKIMSYPDYCPKCGRRTVDFDTYDENNPIVEELIKRNTASESIQEEPVQDPQPAVTVTSGKKSFSLKLSNGSEIAIPETGCIIGRTEVGAEELAEFPSVSRQHIRVTIRRNIGVLIEDISTYGTLVDGIRLEKNLPTRVADEYSGPF